MVDMQDIFENQSEKYHLLVSKEDYEHNLIKEINKIINLHGKDVLEFGAGTGRLTLQLCAYAHEVLALEKTFGMLKTAKYNLNKFKINNCTIREGNNLENLKLMKRYDLAIEGWSFFAAISSTPKQWEKENAIKMLDIQVTNMMRHVKKNGKLIIIESYGSYVDKPSPLDVWVPLYDYLENDLGFTKKIIRTDYKFETVEEAAELFPFFFGEEFKDKIVKEKATIIPEYTGVLFKDN